jgi:hypothetical protein
LSRPAVCPAHGPHDRAQCRNRADHSQHCQPNQEKKARSYIVEDDVVHGFPPWSTRPLPAMPSARADPRGHRIVLHQPTSAARAMPCPSLPRTMVRKTLFGKPVWIIGYHFQPLPSPDHLLFSLYPATGKIYAALVGAPQPIRKTGIFLKVDTTSSTLGIQ